MLRKISYKMNVKNVNNFEFMKGEIYDVNIKSFEILKKKMNKKGIPSLKNITKWGVFIKIKLEDDLCLTCIWDLGNTLYTNAMMPNGKIKKKSKKKIKTSIIPTIFRACGVSEWSELIGTTVRVKDTFGWHVNNECIHGDPYISPMNDDENIMWFYPNYYSIDIDGYKDIDDKTEETEDDISEYESEDILGGEYEIERILDNIIKENDGCIYKEQQDSFKDTMTSLFKSHFGNPGYTNNKSYGLIPINDILKRNNIGYRIKIVYKTKTTPRHWKVYKVTEN